MLQNDIGKSFSKRMPAEQIIRLLKFLDPKTRAEVLASTEWRFQVTTGKNILVQIEKQDGEVTFIKAVPKRA